MKRGIVQNVQGRSSWVLQGAQTATNLLEESQEHPKDHNNLSKSNTSNQNIYMSLIPIHILMSLQIDNTRKVYRQGDIEFLPIKKKDIAGLKLEKRKSNVIAHGESGNKHQFQGQHLIYDIADPIQVGELNAPVQEFVEVKEAELVHEEHNPQKLEEGLYAVTHEREFNSVLDNVNQVAD